MPKYAYSFKSEIGTFWINPERNKRWSLLIGDDIIEAIGYYDSPDDAADAVYMKTTGWDEWDDGEDDAPMTLQQWTKKPEK